MASDESQDPHKTVDERLDQRTTQVGPASPPSAPAESPTLRIGPYRVVRELGRGGMGTVLLAERADEQYHTHVAVKLIKSGAQSEDVVRRFRQERQILANLQHPNIARLLDGGTTEDGVPYLVMEYIDGQTLHEYCESRRLGTAERLRLFLPVCAAVQHAHRNLVVHRDLKPSNVLVTGEGVPKLLDFGIAKLLVPENFGHAVTATAFVMTPRYASPEQIRGEPITTATDVYSLGVVLYELLTGRYPYRLQTDQPIEVLRAVIEAEPERPSATVDETPRLRRQLEGDLDNVLLMALRKEPQRRYPSVEALAEDVGRHLEGRPVAARRSTLGYRAGKFVRRNRVAVASGALVVMLLAGFAGAMAVQSARLARERDHAARERDRAERVSAFLAELFRVSDPGEARGSTVTAREVLDRGAVQIRGELADEPEVRAALLDVMGTVYLNLGLYDRARSLLEEAVEARRRAPERDDAGLARSLRALGEALGMGADFVRGEAVLREAVALSRARFGGGDPEVARCLTLLAELLDKKGEYAAAEPLLREALAIRRAAFGEGHPEVADTLNFLGLVTYHRGDFRGAEAQHRQALEIRRRSLGEDHHLVAQSLNNLAVALERAGDWETTEALHREALALRRKVLGAEHPRVAMTLHNLAAVLARKGDYDAAEATGREALAMRRKLLGDEHPDVALSLQQIGRVLHEKGDLRGAESRLRESLALKRRMLGPGHAGVADTLNALGEVLAHAGRDADAEACFREAVDILRRAGGPEAPLSGTPLRGLAWVLGRTGRAREGAELAREALGLLQRAYPEGHVEIGEAESVLGACLLAAGQPAQARPLLDSGHQSLVAKLGEGSWRTRLAQLRLSASKGDEARGR